MNAHSGFAVWITGLPASGKSSVTRVLARALRERRIPVVVLESDEMRRILAPGAAYGRSERDRFYGMLAALGAEIVRQGVNVIFDATANRRSYRAAARAVISDFIEVHIRCPLDVCMMRDPKGIYRRAREGSAEAVPGLQEPYEPPEAPEVSLDGQANTERSADAILEKLKQLLYI